MPGAYSDQHIMDLDNWTEIWSVNLKTELNLWNIHMWAESNQQSKNFET